MSIEAKPSAQQTLVDTGTTLKGGIVSSCPVRVNGTVEGALEVPELTVSAGGTVKGSVFADSVRSEGTIGGTLKAKRVQLSGAILPNTLIEADELDIQLQGEGRSLQLTFDECQDTTDKSVSPPGGKRGAQLPTGANAS